MGVVAASEQEASPSSTPPCMWPAARTWAQLQLLAASVAAAGPELFCNKERPSMDSIPTASSWVCACHARSVLHNHHDAGATAV